MASVLTVSRNPVLSSRESCQCVMAVTPSSKFGLEQLRQQSPGSVRCNGCNVTFSQQFCSVFEWMLVRILLGASLHTGVIGAQACG